jgi:hypothetical protein
MARYRKAGGNQQRRRSSNAISIGPLPKPLMPIATSLLVVDEIAK